MITSIVKPNSKLQHEIRPFEPDPEYKQDFQKSMRIVVMEMEKTGKIYDGTGRFYWHFKLHLN